MSSVNFKMYGLILRQRRALVFDVGGLLVRMFSAQVVLGVVTMLTLCGWSFLLSGSISAVVALSSFFIAPQVSRKADELGQSRVAPAASGIAVAGLALMLITLQVNGPFWLCYPAAVLMGFCPNAPSYTRTRWTYMVETGMLGQKAPDLKTVFAFEGVLDDAAFMLGPSCAIALSSILFPTAGMLFGGIMLVVGTALLLAPRSTEPTPGWKSNAGGEEQEEQSKGKARSMFLSSGFVRMLFLIIFATGLFYSTHDTVLVAIGEEIGRPEYVSLILFLASLLSMCAGFVFGSIKLKASLPAQMLVIAGFFGCCYALMAVASGLGFLTVVCTVSALFYGPLIITVNTMCEKGVPSSRLTESLTWVNSGYVCGSAIAPILSGLAVDMLGGMPCLKMCGALALLVFVFGLLAQPIVRKALASKK